MNFLSAAANGVYIIEPEPVIDERGWFARTYCKKLFGQIGHTKEWVQMNHSYTRSKGTVRGLHLQRRPFQEIKLIRCVRGTVWDVAVDLRANSDTFLKYVAVELSAENRRMIYIPEGFAHGFQSLTDDCEMIYHHSAYYDKTAEHGIRYNDPKIAVNWPLPVTEISLRDRSHELLDEQFKGLL